LRDIFLNKENSFLLKQNFKNSKFLSYISLYNLFYEELEAYSSSYFCSEEIDFISKIEWRANKVNYLMGRIAAKDAISRLTKINDKKNIIIGSGIFGQPIVNCLERNVVVSISHCDNHAIAIASNEAYLAGIDIENLTDKKIENTKSQLTKYELRNFVDNYESCFALMLWTAKEALSKVLKTGINCDFALYEIKAIKIHKDHILMDFVNFPQYQAASYFFKDIVFSVILPQLSEFLLVREF
jgi:4'-phosphopantetheinyl transferase